MRLWSLAALCLGIVLGVASAGEAAAPPPLTSVQRKRLLERKWAAGEVRQLQRDGKLVDAIAAARRELQLDIDLFANRQLFQSDSRELLAEMLMQFAQQKEGEQLWKEAEAARKEALDLRKLAFGADDWRVTDARLDLARTRRLAKLKPDQWKQLQEANRHNSELIARYNQRKYKEALAAGREALRAYREVLGEKDTSALRELVNLGLIHDRLGQPAQAQKYYREGVRLGKEVMGELHPDMVNALLRLADSLRKEKPDEAVLLYERAMKSQLLLFGKESSTYLHLLRILAGVYESSGKREKSIALRTQAVAIRRARGADKLEDATEYLELAQLQRKAGDLDRAERLLREALKVVRRATPLARNRESAHAVHEAVFKELVSLHEQLRRHNKRRANYQRLVLDQAAFYHDQAKMNEGERNEPRSRAAWDIVLKLTMEGLDPKQWRAVDARVAVARAIAVAGLDYEQQASLAKAGEDAHSVVIYRRYTGNLAAALVRAEAALRAHRRILGPGHPDCAASHHLLALVHHDRGEGADAASHFRQAFEIRRKALGEEHPHTAASLNGLGATLFEAGDYARAASCLQRSLESLREAIEPGADAHLVALNNLAVLHQTVGDHVRAEPLLRQALGLHREALAASTRLADEQDHADDRIALSGEISWAGVFYRVYAGRDDKAALRRRQLRLAVYLSNLGRTYAVTGKSADAEKCLQEGVGVFQALMDSERADRKFVDPNTEAAFAKCLTNLGLHYLQKKSYNESQRYLEQSLKVRQQIAERPGYKPDPNYAAGFSSLAALHYARGEYALAEKALARALAINGKAQGERSFVYALNLGNLALVLDAAGRPGEALPLARKAVDLCRDTLVAIAGVQSEQQQFGALQMFRGQLDHFLSLSLRQKAKAAEVYAPVLAWKGSVFAGQQALRERRLLRGDADAAKLRSDLDDVTRKWASATYTADSLEKINLLSERYQRLDRELAEKASTARQRRLGTLLTPADLCQSLPRGVALIDYLEFLHDEQRPGGKGTRQKHLLAFVITRGGITFHDLGRAEEIGRAVDRWRQGAKWRRRPVMGKGDPAVLLRERLWAPLEKDLAEARTLLVSPDGFVNHLPLAALPGQDSSKYLLEERALAVVPAPQALPGLLARGVSAGEDQALLVVGDVDYGVSEKRWPSLPATRGELLAVRDSFESKYPFPDGQTRALRGTRATVANFREQAPRHRWLHLATHGFFMPEGQPSAVVGKGDNGLVGDSVSAGRHPGLLSGLVLAGANRQPRSGEDGGFLTALEVAGLDLGGVELATLSACETGLGKVAGGEGLLGLQRAFQVAGARSVVASLWKVDDKATRELMDNFYSHLWGGENLPAKEHRAGEQRRIDPSDSAKQGKRAMSKVEALRQAQLEMLRDGMRRGKLARIGEKEEKGTRMPPYYWAGFVLSGDWR